MSQPHVEQIERTIANEILDNNIILTLRETDEFCLYNGGYFYRGQTPHTQLREYVDIISRTTLIPGVNQTLRPYNLTNSKKATILEMLKSNSFASLDDFDQESDIICCKNGIYKISGFKKCILPNPNSADGSYNSKLDEKMVLGTKCFLSYEQYRTKFGAPYKTFIQVPVDYDPDKECLIIDQFLSDVFGFKIVPLIYEMLAYFLMPHIKYQKAFILHGPPSTGKTTFYDLIKKFYNGLQYFSELRLQDLGVKYEMQNLIGKLVNYFDDLTEESIGDTEAFRRIVTNNTLSSAVKFVNGLIYWRNRTKLVFSCNDFPAIKKKEGNAFFRRWVLLSCFNVFKDKNSMTQEDNNDPTVNEKDYDILEKMCTESEFSGLLNKILEAWIRLETRGNFPPEWNNPEYIKGLWQIDVNPVKLFVDECCIIGPIEKTDYNEFYFTLNKFRESKNAHAISKHSCTQWLQQIDGITKKRKTGGVYYYAGIGLKDSVRKKYEIPLEPVITIEEFTDEQMGYLENNDDKKGYNEDYSDPGRF